MSLKLDHYDNHWNWIKHFDALLFYCDLSSHISDSGITLSEILAAIVTWESRLIDLLPRLGNLGKRNMNFFLEFSNFWQVESGSERSMLQTPSDVEGVRGLSPMEDNDDVDGCGVRSSLTAGVSGRFFLQRKRLWWVFPGSRNSRPSVSVGVSGCFTCQKNLRILELPKNNTKYYMLYGNSTTANYKAFKFAHFILP